MKHRDTEFTEEEEGFTEEEEGWMRRRAEVVM